MSDRVLVMREGRITGRFERGEATQETVMATATTGQPAAMDGANLAAVDGETFRRPPESGLAANWMKFRELGIAAVVAITFVLCAVRQPRFVSPENLRSIMLYIPLIVVVAMGEMMIIISRNIDLSVGSILGLAAIVVGNLYISHPGMPLWMAAIACAFVGGAAGLLNGLLVALLRVPAIIATLGTLTAYRGLIFIYSGGRQVDNNDLPASLIRLSRTSAIGVPGIVLFAAAVAIGTAPWLRYARTGREIFAIGSNPSAAVLRGIPVSRVLLLIFTLTGVLSGLAGLMFASRFGYVNPVSTGSQMELVVISAVVIGGTNVLGGSGTVLGVILGCLLLGLVNVGLPMLDISAFWQLALYGMAILLAATVDTLIQRRISGGEQLA
jgi:rhamnose transport system permease protein